MLPRRAIPSSIRAKYASSGGGSGGMELPGTATVGAERASGGR